VIPKSFLIKSDKPACFVYGRSAKGSNFTITEVLANNLNEKARKLAKKRRII